jgi:hypothetical protein
MLAMNAPYTESQSYAIPLGENCSHREMVIRVDVPHMWFRIEGEPPPPHEDKSTLEREFFPINTQAKAYLGPIWP